MYSNTSQTPHCTSTYKKMCAQKCIFSPSFKTTFKEKKISYVRILWVTTGLQLRKSRLVKGGCCTEKCSFYIRMLYICLVTSSCYHLYKPRKLPYFFSNVFLALYLPHSSLSFSFSHSLLYSSLHSLIFCFFFCIFFSCLFFFNNFCHST